MGKTLKGAPATQVKKTVDGLATGIDDYLGKPIRVEELVAALGKCQPAF